jgi:hypothetical protein
VTRQRPAAERLFEQYLDAHGYRWEHEPAFGTATAPDYWIERLGVEVVCEVKQFETDAIREMGRAAGGAVVIPPKLLYRTIRGGIAKAAKQLKPLADRGLPLVVVLSNPCRASLLLSPPTLFHAMYGDDRWAAPDEIAPTIEQWPIPTAAGRDGEMTSKHSYISAVLALGRRRDPEELFDPPARPDQSTAPYVHVVDALGDAAVPLPLSVFDGSSDARWSPDRRRRYVQVTGTHRPGSLSDDA